MEIHYSDLLFWLFEEKGAEITESPTGIKIIEYVYKDGKMAIFIFDEDNQLIAWHFEQLKFLIDKLAILYYNNYRK